MARIEARRLARNPFFILATLVALAFNAVFADHRARRRLPVGDQLAWPVTSAFFIGLTSLVAALPADPEHGGRRRGR